MNRKQANYLKIIQNNDSKYDQVPWKQNGKNQESTNKDLELKKKHTETKNIITQIKNTPEGINSRISEAKEQISELEDKMVEITSEEQKKAKRMKRIEDSFRDLWDQAPTFELQGSQKKKRKRKGIRKFLKRLELKISPTWKRKQPIKSKRHKESHTG